MKKKILLFIALISMLACAFAISISAETPEKYIEFGAKFPDSDEYITVYTENAENTSNPRIDFANKKFYSDVDFTQEVNMSTVTGIDFSVCKTYANGVEGKAPNRVTNPSSAFVNCTEVKWFTQEGAMDYTVPKALFNGWISLRSFDFGSATAINDNAFQKCGFESITIPKTITSVGGSVFTGCESLTSVDFEGDVTSFGNGGTFSGCTALTSVDLTNLTKIAGSMFNGCTALTSIVIPATIESIANQAFLSCSSLSSITLNEGLKTIGSRAFEGSGLTAVEIPSTVTTLNEKCFYNNTKLTSVTFSESSQLTTIGSNAFYKVPAGIDVPSTVTSLGSGAFAGSGIQSITIPDGTTSINSNEYKECTSLTSITIPASVTSIGEYAFQGCTALESFTIKGDSQLETIGKQAFQNCKALSNIVFEGKCSLTTIGEAAFQNALVSSFSIPSTVTKIGNNAFRSSGIKTVVIPAGLTSIGTYVFHTSKVESLSFADGFTGPLSFGVGVFQGCSSLATIELAEGLTSIGQECFTNAIATSITLPDSVISIGNLAFGNCKQLTTFTINPTSKLTTLGSQVFKDGIALTSFYFPNSLTSIGSNLFIYNNGSLKELINFENCGVTSIPEGVFSQCSGLKEVKFPYGVTEINGKDLLKWANLDSITLPQTLKTITNPITCNSVTKIIFAAPEGTPLPANAPDTTVEYANYCETYFASAHTESDEYSYTYVDENGNPTDEAYTSALKISCQCGRECGTETEIETIPAIFKCLGISAQEYGNGGILIAFGINNTAIDKYEKATNSKLTIGLFAGRDTKLGTNEAVSSDGEALAGIVSVDYTERNYDIVEFKVIGFVTDDYKNAQIALGAYVIEEDGEGKSVTYLQAAKPSNGEKYSYISYNELVG